MPYRCPDFGPCLIPFFGSPSVPLSPDRPTRYLVNKPLWATPRSKLGGQALVLDVEGTWRELTDVVNKLAANLTSQVRSIAFVTTAVARGDLSKQIDVDARGEILDLKNTVNGMVVQLRALAAEVTKQPDSKAKRQMYRSVHRMDRVGGRTRAKRMLGMA